MWANAQRDGRPAEHRWCPLFNAAKLGSRPLRDCRAVTLQDAKAVEIQSQSMFASSIFAVHKCHKSLFRTRIAA